MLKKRIIPKLILGSNSNSDRIIAGTSKNFSVFRPTGSPESQAQIYQSTISDELMVLISSIYTYKFSIVIDTLTKINNEVLMPVSFGGNIKDLFEVESIFKTGVERVVFGRAQLLIPKLIEQVSERYGSQSVVVSIDFRESENNDNEVWHDCFGASTLINFERLIKNAENLGAGEISLNNKSLDGSLAGTDLNHLIIARKITSLPIIQNCGVGKISHFVDAFNSGADAVAAGTYFSFLDQNILQVRNHISSLGVDIRN